MSSEKVSKFLSFSVFYFKSIAYEKQSVSQGSKLLRGCLSLVALSGGAGWPFAVLVLGWGF